MGKSIFIVFFNIFFFLSCSQDGEIEDTIHSAKIYLSSRKCQDAIDTLESIGRYNRNAKYVQTLSSAYACRANYSTPEFYGTNVGKIKGTHTMGSFSTFTTSIMTSPNDPEYEDLQTAIDILRYAGDVRNPISEEREDVFSQDDHSNINMQLLYMIITQLGKYVFYYGNANYTLRSEDGYPGGEKGCGSEISNNGNTNKLDNKCFYKYDPTPGSVYHTFIFNQLSPPPLGLGQGTKCEYNDDGHPKLQPLPDPNTVTRMCQGVILFNSFVNVLSNTTAPLSGGELGNLSSTFANLCSETDYLAYTTGNICTVSKLSDCESDYAVAPGSDQLQTYFLIIYELTFRGSDDCKSIL